TKPGPIVPLIAETGGINAMIVDSTALPEQVVDAVIASSFRSAGQRCSALRLLCLQEDIADSVLTMLAGAMQELVVGDPADYATDVGPVIDAEAQKKLQQQIQVLAQSGGPVGGPPRPGAAPRVLGAPRGD
ncbi:MAG: aldehyde dehydrogenase family protein, partial [Burkholderiaceae bacterium]